MNAPRKRDLVRGALVLIAIAAITLLIVADQYGWDRVKANVRGFFEGAVRAVLVTLAWGLVLLPALLSVGIAPLAALVIAAVASGLYNGLAAVSGLPLLRGTLGGGDSADPCFGKPSGYVLPDGTICLSNRASRPAV